MTSIFRGLALKAARDMDIYDFQASHHWLIAFKRRHGICSRKVANIVTKREITDIDNIKKSDID